MMSRRPDSLEDGITRASSVIACVSLRSAVWRTVTIELVPLNNTALLGCLALGNVATGPDAANAVPTNSPNAATAVTSAIMSMRAGMRKSPNSRPRS